LDSYEGLGLYIALSRFAPIGIYGEERRAWGPHGGYGGAPTIDNVYCISPSWESVAADVASLMREHGIYMPPIDELSRPITINLPQLLRDNANRGQSLIFHLIFNDLY
jgi:hypothetical protein